MDTQPPQLFDTYTQHPLRLHVLGSGSGGNAAIISCEDGAVLVDAGFSAREILKRTQAINFDPSQIKALLITHDHSDHRSGAGVISRNLSLPVYASGGTLSSPGFARCEVYGERVMAGEPLTLCGMTVTPYATSHDAAEPLGFHFSYKGDSIGLVSDTGVVTDEMVELLTGVRVLAIESNHDLTMLAQGPYPQYLKQRIRSEQGHLSNEQTAEAIERIATDNLERVVGMHLSETNNLPLLSKREISTKLKQMGHDAHVECAGQLRPRICETPRED